MDGETSMESAEMAAKMSKRVKVPLEVQREAMQRERAYRNEMTGRALPSTVLTSTHLLSKNTEELIEKMQSFH